MRARPRSSRSRLSTIMTVSTVTSSRQRPRLEHLRHMRVTKEQPAGELVVLLVERATGDENSYAHLFSAATATTPCSALGRKHGFEIGMPILSGPWRAVGAASTDTVVSNVSLRPSISGLCGSRSPRTCLPGTPLASAWAPRGHNYVYVRNRSHPDWRNRHLLHPSSERAQEAGVVAASGSRITRSNRRDADHAEPSTGRGSCGSGQRDADLADPSTGRGSRGSQSTGRGPRGFQSDGTQITRIWSPGRGSRGSIVTGRRRSRGTRCPTTRG